MRSPEWRRYAERAALARTALGRYAAPVKLYQLPQQRKTDSRTLVGSPARAFHAVETLEDMRQFRRGYADAGIGDGKRRTIAIGPHPHRDASLKRELECVREKVQHNLLPHVPVYIDGLRERLAIDNQCQPRCLNGRPEIRSQFCRKRGEIGRHIRRI